MDEMALVEQTDVSERNAEGGGVMPRSMQQVKWQQQQLGNMGQEGSQGVWYKNKTWLGWAMTWLICRRLSWLRWIGRLRMPVVAQPSSVVSSIKT